MSSGVRRMLHVVALRHDLPLEGWQHYGTSAGDDGVSYFYFDRDPSDGPAGLVVRVDGNGYHLDTERSWLEQLGKPLARCAP